MLLSILKKKVVSGADIRECTGPCATIVSHATVFEVGGCKSPGSQSGAQMSSVIEAVLGAPEPSMNVDDQRARLASAGGQPQVDELMGIGPVCDAEIERR